MNKTFTFSSIPTDASQVQPAKDAFEAAALTVLVLCNYKNSPEKTIEMLNVLKGPQPMSQYDMQFLRDRLKGKEYKPFSFFAGSSPENGYTPAMPLTITVEDNPYSYNEQGYAMLYIRSSGADSIRQIKLRTKPSTGEWFLWENYLLSDIRIPVSQDPWA